MHFYVGGDRDAGRREGHGEVSREWYYENLGHPLEHPAKRYLESEDAEVAEFEADLDQQLGLRLRSD